MEGSAHFNPRSREGSDLAADIRADLLSISIHAPAKGATDAEELERMHRDISIHAPAKGATLTRQARIACFSDFNPRSREGSDSRACHRRSARWTFQSTLPRRERLQKPQKRRRCVYFNPRSREGSDVGNRCSFNRDSHFNPRSREGSDNTPKSGCLSLSDFNPRSREGSDKATATTQASIKISIHAPAKGATRQAAAIIQDNGFQSTLPRRERP